MTTPETNQKRAIKQYLAWKKYFVFHNVAGIGSYAGVPDITAIKDGQVYQVEVKAPGGKQRAAQKVFQDDWERNGGIYIIGDIDEIMAKMK